jgi:NhaA family Na+:H+ antiporter
MPLRKYIFNPIRQLAEHGKLSGILLIGATLFSLLLSNFDFGASYLGLWHTELGFSFLHFDLRHWINDALMPLFFLLVGIEIKREVVKGELSRPRQAILPVAAAAGGILVPAAIYAAFNFNNPETISGWAIPTATDIAFSLGILSMLGRRVPFAIKIFLTALAIIDDLGAILIIAVFYTGSLQLTMLLYAGLAMLALILMNLFRIRTVIPYMLVGVLLWYFILRSGIHPTIAGVLAAFTIPSSLAEKAEEKMNNLVYYAILPLFALANTAIPLQVSITEGLFSGLNLGIMFGLVAGKPLGILLFTFILVRTRLGKLPGEVTWRQLLGMGLTAGIGFTMSIFIATLSFGSETLTDMAKLAVLAGSMAAAIAGILVLLSVRKGREEEENGEVTGSLNIPFSP